MLMAWSARTMIQSDQVEPCIDPVRDVPNEAVAGVDRPRREARCFVTTLAAIAAIGHELPMLLCMARS